MSNEILEHSDQEPSCQTNPSFHTVITIKPKTEPEDILAEPDVDHLTTPKSDPEYEFSDELYYENPWNVSNLKDFLVYQCPECDFQSPKEVPFFSHAFSEHSQAKSYFTTNPVFSELVAKVQPRLNPKLESKFDSHFYTTLIYIQLI